MAGAAAFPDDIANADADEGGVGDAPVDEVAAAEGTLALTKELYGDGFALPAIRAKDAVGFCNGLPSL